MELRLVLGSVLALELGSGLVLGSLWALETVTASELENLFSRLPHSSSCFYRLLSRRIPCKCTWLMLTAPCL